MPKIKKAGGGFGGRAQLPPSEHLEDWFSIEFFFRDYFLKRP